jgi:hypothetical protein
VSVINIKLTKIPNEEVHEDDVDVAFGLGKVRADEVAAVSV